MKHLLTTLLAAALLTACNSGGGSPSTESTENNPNTWQSKMMAENEFKDIKWIQSISSDGERAITNINENLYYKSTGENSGIPNMVLPFSGYERSWFIKNPTEASFVDLLIRQNFLNAVKDPVAKAMLNIALNETARCYFGQSAEEDAMWEDLVSGSYHFRNLLSRLSSLDDARVSYQFQSGGWEKDPKETCLYLKNYFKYTEQVNSFYRFTENPSSVFDLTKISKSSPEEVAFNQFINNFKG